ncbi:MAG: CvpA family protein [Cocleimonas sp.]
MDVNIFDIVIVVLILITALIGFMRGLVWMAVFIATWAAAIFFALKYKDQLSAILPIKLSSEFLQTGIAALLIFLGVLLAGAIINAILHKLINAVGFGAFDRILGTVLGVLLGAFAITLLTMLAGLTELPDQESWAKSKFIPKFQEAAEWIKTQVPDDLNKYIDETLGSPTKAITTPPTDSVISPTESQPAGITPTAI